MLNLKIKNEPITLTAGDGHEFLTLQDNDKKALYSLQAPQFEIEGISTGGSDLKLLSVDSERKLRNDGTEIILRYAFKTNDALQLALYLRYFPGSPFIRYKYGLTSVKPLRMTKSKGCDNIGYTGYKTASDQVSVTEVQFSQFEAIVHSFMPHFQEIDANDLAAGLVYPGPITIIEGRDNCCLLAYEHGAEYPDTFLSFSSSHQDTGLSIDINAVKGNYYDGQVIDQNRSFHTPWFHFACINGSREELLKHYRNFLLKYICENAESRKPYIFYNTWNYQERNRYFNDKPYLDSMNLDRISQEIDIAHEMGIDVFVIDTGWYNKTGDWIVDDKKFPDGLKKVKEKLDSHGMKLGLWFNPIVAAKTSDIFLAHPEYVIEKDGHKNFWGKIWETEESYGMCLASGYSDYFIKKLVQLNKELGVSYFKWDAIGQYGCNCPHHKHGTEANSPGERQDCYSFSMGMEMIRIVEEVTRQCPEVIVDFDITEGGRFVGLGFLSVGKYFLINNGPYAKDFDLPESYTYYQKEPVRIDPWTNIFFYPGPARARVCRQGTRYDSFVPSTLFLTHFLPDAPGLSQMNSLCTLMLGPNGIWGDLLALAESDIIVFKDTLGKYKKVAANITASYPRVKGFIGSSPEIHEKIEYEKAAGLVCFFTRAGGNFTHITGKIDKSYFSHLEGADSYELLEDGRLKITVSLGEDEARPIFIFSK